MIFQEFQAFADASAGLQTYDSSGSFNVAALQGSGPVSASKLTPSTWQADNVNNVIDLNIQSFLRGNGGGDAQFLLDLGSVHMVESIGLGFFHGNSWANGITIEASPDNVNFQTVFDTSSSTTSTHANSDDWAARYLRVTNKGGSGGALTEFEVFAAPLPTLAETPADGSTFDFGSVVEFTSTTLSDAITLQNIGESTSELSVLSFTLSGLDAGQFAIPDFAPIDLVVGGIDTEMFDLQVNAGAAGDSYTAMLTIHTNVGDVVYNLLAETRVVPEPSSLVLLGLGCVAITARRRKRR